MKKAYLLFAVVVLSSFSLVGCGSSEPTVVETAEESTGAMAADDQAEYERMMKEEMSGRGGN